MSKYSEYNLMRMSETDDEDAYELWELEREEIEDMFSGDAEAFITAYKAYYDDVKTSTDVYKEDW